MAVAQLLLKSQIHQHANEDVVRSLKRGMAISVQESGFNWGREHISFFPNSCFVDITDATVAQLKEVLQPQIEDDEGIPQFDEEGVPKIFRRCRWHVLIDNVPAGTKAQIKANGIVYLTKVQIRTFIRRIRNNDQYAGIN